MNIGQKKYESKTITKIGNKKPKTRQRGCENTQTQRRTIMRKVLVIAAMVIGCSLSAFSWNCSDPLAERVVVPSGTSGTYGDADGQLALYNGALYECKVVPVTPPTTPSTTSNTSNSTSGATSTSTSGANAAGGNSNATGGNSSSKSGVSNSGNSTVGPITNTLSNTNTLSQKQGQKQSQSQSNTSTNNNQSAGGSVSNVGNSQTLVEAPQIPVNTAVAPPVFSTTNCFKGYSAGAQTPLIGGSFGGGGIDKNCAAERIAQDYYAMGNRLAACKVITNTKASKDAGVTMADCMNAPVRPVPVVVPSIPVAVPVINPAPIQVTVNVPPTLAPIIIREEVTVQATKAQVKAATKHKAVHRPCPVTEIQNQCAVKTQEK
jgi:hypothetical protein